MVADRGEDRDLALGVGAHAIGVAFVEPHVDALALGVVDRDLHLGDRQAEIEARVDLGAALDRDLLRVDRRHDAIAELAGVDAVEVHVPGARRDAEHRAVRRQPRPGAGELVADAQGVLAEGRGVADVGAPRRARQLDRQDLVAAVLIALDRHHDAAATADDPRQADGREHQRQHHQPEDAAAVPVDEAGGRAVEGALGAVTGVAAARDVDQAHRGAGAVDGEAVHQDVGGAGGGGDLGDPSGVERTADPGRATVDDLMAGAAQHRDQRGAQRAGVALAQRPPRRLAAAQPDHRDHRAGIDRQLGQHQRELAAQRLGAIELDRRRRDGGRARARASARAAAAGDRSVELRAQLGAEAIGQRARDGGAVGVAVALEHRGAGTQEHHARRRTVARAGQRRRRGRRVAAAERELDGRELLVDRVVGRAGEELRRAGPVASRQRDPRQLAIGARGGEGIAGLVEAPGRQRQATAQELGAGIVDGGGQPHVDRGHDRGGVGAPGRELGGEAERVGVADRRGRGQHRRELGQLGVVEIDRAHRGQLDVAAARGEPHREHRRQPRPLRIAARERERAGLGVGRHRARRQRHHQRQRRRERSRQRQQARDRRRQRRTIAARVGQPRRRDVEPGIAGTATGQLARGVVEGRAGQARERARGSLARRGARRQLEDVLGRAGEQRDRQRGRLIRRGAGPARAQRRGDGRHPQRHDGLAGSDRLGGAGEIAAGHRARRQRERAELSDRGRRHREASADHRLEHRGHAADEAHHVAITRGRGACRHHRAGAIDREHRGLDVGADAAQIARDHQRGVERRHPRRQRGRLIDRQRDARELARRHHRVGGLFDRRAQEQRRRRRVVDEIGLGANVEHDDPRGVSLRDRQQHHGGARVQPGPPHRARVYLDGRALAPHDRARTIIA